MTSEIETVYFHIPASTLRQARSVFAGQARVELVFAAHGFDDVWTQAVVGSFPRERALEMLLAGTGLRVGFGSGGSVIVQRADTSEATGDVGLDEHDSSMTLLARAAVDESRPMTDMGTRTGSGNQSPASTRRGSDQDRSQKLKEITVTGSRIRGEQSASPMVTIDRAEIDMAGFATVENAVEYLPQNFGAGASADSESFGANHGNVVGWAGSC